MIWYSHLFKNFPVGCDPHSSSAGKESACSAGDHSLVPGSGRSPGEGISYPPTPVFLGFPGGSDGKESVYITGDLGLIPGLGKSPGGGPGNPHQYSCLENPHGQRSLGGPQSIGLQRVWCTHTVQHTHTQTSTHTHIHMYKHVYTHTHIYTYIHICLYFEIEAIEEQPTVLQTKQGTMLHKLALEPCKHFT